MNLLYILLFFCPTAELFPIRRDLSYLTFPDEVLSRSPLCVSGSEDLTGCSDFDPAGRMLLRSAKRNNNNRDMNNNEERKKMSDSSEEEKYLAEYPDDTEVEDESQKCYFSKRRSTNFERKKRPETSRVSTTCKGNLKKMISVLESNEVVELFDAQNPLDLLLCRGAGICELDFGKQDVVAEWSKKFICSHHENELLTKWNRREFNHIRLRTYQQVKQPVCSFPYSIDPIHENDIPPFVKSKEKYFLSKPEAAAFLRKEKTLIHAGIPVCKSHKQYSLDTSSQNNIEKKGYYIDPPPATGLLAQSHYIEDESHNTCRVSQKDPNFFARRVHRPVEPRTVDDKVAKAFYAFARETGEKRVEPKIPFIQLMHRTKRRKASMVRNLLNIIFEVCAPDYPDELKAMTLEPEISNIWAPKREDALNTLMAHISELYKDTDNRAEKYSILSIIAHVFPLSQIRQYIPGLSYHMYEKARKQHVFNEPTKVRKVERYNPIAVNLFLEFITSNMIMSSYTFGVKRAKWSDGTTFELPNTIRKQSATEVIRMFQLYLTETNQQAKSMSESTYYRILDICKSTKQKALVCVDYYQADATEATEDLKRVFEKLASHNYITSETRDSFSKRIEESLQYFKTDYRIHTKDKSRIADHCSTHALSDSQDRRLSAKCDHEHSMRCDRCEEAKNTFGDVKDQIKFLIEETEEEYKTNKLIAMRIKLESLKDWSQQIDAALEKLFEFKKHLLRAKYTDDRRTSIIDGLQLNEALVTADFAQKLLPQKFREKQVDYFGKSGLSYHILHVTANVSYQLATHSFVHIMKAKQVSQTVTAIFEHALHQLAKMGIVSVVLKSDNAGAYHSSSTIASMVRISERTKVDVMRYSFSEPQNGKSSCDRVASQVKRKVHQWVDSGNDVENEEQFFNALTTKSPLKGTSVYVGKLDNDEVVSKPKKKPFDSISLLYDFTFYRNYVVGKSYEGIGSGIVVKQSDLVPNESKLIIEHAGGKLADQTSIAREQQIIETRSEPFFWYFSRPKQPEPSQSNNVLNDITGSDDTHHTVKNDVFFHCPQLGCSASFVHYLNLERHISKGKHNISPERLTLRDFALHTFKEKIESVESTENDVTSNLPVGWALREKRSSGQAYGNANARNILEFREQILKHYGFDDIYIQQKEIENQFAIKQLPTVLARIDELKETLSEDSHFEYVCRGLLAGNVFDWGAKEVVKMMNREGGLSFAEAINNVESRPWLFDDFDAFNKKSSSYNCALIFVDNSGCDYLLGIVPFAREMMRKGTKVIICANSSPALNDLTFSEMSRLIKDLCELDKELNAFISSGQMLFTENGQGSPCLDLRRVHTQLNRIVHQHKVDLIVIEGMGRALHTNFNVQFKCDVLKAAVIKTKWLADRFGGKMFSVVFKFENGTEKNIYADQTEKETASASFEAETETLIVPNV